MVLPPGKPYSDWVLKRLFQLETTLTTVVFSKQKNISYQNAQLEVTIILVRKLRWCCLLASLTETEETFTDAPQNTTAENATDSLRLLQNAHS